MRGHKAQPGESVIIIICTRGAGKLCKARIQLHRSRSLKPNTRWKALAEIHTIHSVLQISISFPENCPDFAKRCQLVGKLYRNVASICRNLNGILREFAEFSGVELTIVSECRQTPVIPASAPVSARQKVQVAVVSNRAGIAPIPLHLANNGELSAN